MVSLAKMKTLIKSELDSYPPYPEVVGDRRLIRFLRGFNNNVEKASTAYLKFLQWRKDNRVDDIRNEILYGGANHPHKFPLGPLMLQVVPQIVIAPHALDHSGQPITLEIYDFDPVHVLEQITVQQYLVFLIYSCEFRTLILEQLSEEREKQYLLEHPNPQDRQDNYGVVVKLCCLRDLKGILSQRVL
jgi:hypothetical protein